MLNTEKKKSEASNGRSYPLQDWLVLLIYFGLFFKSQARNHNYLLAIIIYANVFMQFIRLHLITVHAEINNNKKTIIYLPTTYYFKKMQANLIIN